MIVIVYYLLVTSIAAEVFTQHNVTCKPYVVRFSDRLGVPTSLKVDLKVINMPMAKGLDYNVIAYSKSGSHYIQKYIFKYGSETSEYRSIKVEIRQNVNSGWDNCYIAYCMYKEQQRHCVLDKDFLSLYDVIILQYSDEETYSDCVAGRCELTLDLKNYCKNMDAADSEDRPPVNTGLKKLSSPNLDGRDHEHKSFPEFIAGKETGVDFTPGPDLGLVCGLVVGIFLLLVVVAILGRLLYNKRNEGGYEENQYATAAELTYAELDLPDTGASATSVTNGHNTSPYVQIVGVYNPGR